jgi:hypothetical protein
MGDRAPSGRRCQQCGAPLDSDQQFCTECGAPQDAPSQEQQGPPPGEGQGPPPGQQGPPPGQQSPPGQQGPPPGQQSPPGQQGNERSTAFWVIVAIVGLCVIIPVVVVIGSAVLGAFVLGLGETRWTAPDTEFGYDYSPGTSELVVTHEGGDTVNASQITFQGTGFDGVGTTWAQQAGGDGTVAAGDRVTLTRVQDNHMVEIVWTSESDPENTVVISVGERQG